MTTKLWRISPRPCRYASLTEQFTRDESGTNARNEVAPDLFFGDEQAVIIEQNTAAFTITGSSTIRFRSAGTLGGPDFTVPILEWLKLDDALRIILVEMDYIDQVGSGESAVPTKFTRLFANVAFFDEENGVTYRECLTAAPRFNRALQKTSLAGRVVTSIGSVELNNDDGEFDDLLTLACDGSEIRFYMGDGGDIMSARRPWLRSEFVFMFSAMVSKISAPSPDRISIALRDTSAILENAIVGGNVIVGGSGSNANKYRPKIFGYVHNITLLLQDAASLTYVYAESGTNTQLMAVRCRGLSIAYVDNFDGTLRLMVSPAGGLVTADVLVVSAGRVETTMEPGFSETIGAYRVSDAMYTLVGIDAGLIARERYAGAAGNTHSDGYYYLGIYEPDPRPLTEVLDAICESTNLYWTMRRDGYFIFGGMRPEAIEAIVTETFDSVATITNDSLISPNAISIDHALPAAYEVQGYGTINWTPQTDLATSLPEDEAELYRRKGYFWESDTGGDTQAYSGPSDGNGYGVWIFSNPEYYHLTMKRELGIRTLISGANDTTDVAAQLFTWQSIRRTMRLPWLEFVEVAVDLSYFQVEIGNIVTLNLQEVNGTYRFGFNNTLFQVCGIDIALTEHVVRLTLVRRRPAVLETYYSG